MLKKRKQNAQATKRPTSGLNVRYDTQGNAVWRWDSKGSHSKRDIEAAIYYDPDGPIDTSSLELEDSKVEHGRAGTNPYDSPLKKRDE